MENLIVLVHSPLAGPFTWAPVAERLRAMEYAVLVPALADRGVTPPPYWQQHAAAVQQSLAMVPQEQPLILVGHSGAGAELPVLARASHHPVNGYLFVDAGLPHPGQSRLSAIDAMAPAVAQALQRLFTAGERFPTWSEADLLEELPDAAVRRQVLAELQPRARDFFTEVLPVVDGWPDAPWGYLVFTPGYRHFWKTPSRPAGRTARWRPGIFTCWWIRSRWRTRWVTFCSSCMTGRHTNVVARFGG